MINDNILSLIVYDKWQHTIIVNVWLMTTCYHWECMINDNILSLIIYDQWQHSIAYSVWSMTTYYHC
jgi:hypothetical protein